MACSYYISHSQNSIPHELRFKHLISKGGKKKRGLERTHLKGLVKLWNEFSHGNDENIYLQFSNFESILLWNVFPQVQYSK